MKMIRRSLIACSILLAACAGTSNNTAGTSQMAVNTSCPMVPDHAVDDTAPTVMFNGQKVGFCCAKCVGGWNKLDDAGKQAKLSAAKPQK